MKKIVTAIMISVLCVSSCKERKKAPETIINAPVVTSEELVSPYFDKERGEPHSTPFKLTFPSLIMNGFVDTIFGLS